MGGIIGRFLCVHDITIRVIIVLTIHIYIYRTQPIVTDLLGGGTIGTAIWVRDISTDTSYEEGVGQILPQGGLQADGMAIAEGLVRRLVLPTSGVCNGGSGVAGDGYLRLRPPEHSSAIYCDYTYYGPMSGGKAEVRAKGGNAVEGAFSDKELRGSVLAWQRKRHRRVRIVNSLPILSPSPRYPPSSIWGEFLLQRTTTGSQPCPLLSDTPEVVHH